MNTKMMEQFSVMDNEELEIVSGGRGNLGSAIGGCIGAATLICVGSGIMSSL
ncbi:TPA: class IIb bacteriocin, lactobin A/cerein 7B family [Streptococcus pneumoniae]|nr:bacteriocin BlpI [Streptococcus pneumoniae]HET4781542.1 class IIb bacteriocin, lactobin A/cerein 7B family [Streptococcus pneumoniae]